MTVDELLDRITSYELTEWEAEFEIRAQERELAKLKHDQSQTGFDG